MSDMYFDLYYENTMRLARSLVIKFSDIAVQNNHQLTLDGIEVDPDKPETWKYYMNLTGEYHSTDVMMQVRSADTLEMIDFTKENLKLHRATAREYFPGSQLYNNLTLYYPTQTALINGILYPIEMDRVLSAADGEIIYYDNAWVEGNEDTLIHDIQYWINTFILRWYNPQFNLVGDLNLHTFLGNFYSKLPLGIMLARLRNIKTNKAHSYHVREYLASNNGLDRYMPYLNTQQKLWLYRNIHFLRRNAGKQYIWDRLVDNILTPRGIPLISYTLEQNSSKMPEELRPSVHLIKHNVNMPIINEDQNTVNIDALLRREDGLARDNPEVRYETELEITQSMSSDRYSTLKTKVFDSEVIDRSNSNVRSLMSVLLSEWLHLASSDQYRAYVQIPNPRTGEYMQMSVKDAFIVMLYSYLRIRQSPVRNIPRVIAYTVMRDRPPTFAELRAMVSKRLIPDALITAIQDRVTPMGNYISTEQFYLDCVVMHKDYLKLWELYSYQEHSVARAMCESTVMAHYMDRKCSLVDTTISFEQYFKDLSYPIVDLNQFEYEQLCTDCVNIATGSNLVTVITLGEIQKELLKLMGELSSYPLQYLRNVSLTKFHVLGMLSTRVGDITTAAKDLKKIKVVDTNVQRYSSNARQTYYLTNAVIFPPFTYDYHVKTAYKIPTELGVKDLSFNKGKYKLKSTLGIRNVSIRTIEKPFDDNLKQFNNSDDPNWPKLGI